MGVKFACHVCGKELNIKSTLAGKRGKCPDCATRFRIPLDDQPYSIPLDEPSGTELTTAADVAAEEGDESPDQLVRQDESRGARQVTEHDFDPLDDPGAQWYVRPPNGGRYGPANGATVRQWIAEGRVTRTTLLWRDGWAQWRDCDDIIPEAFVDTPAPVGAQAPPTILRESSSPIIDLGATQKSMSDTAAKGSPVLPADPYLGAKKQRRVRQRVTLISILAAIAVILIVALVVALAWPR